ncbi:MAG: flavodoxin family protein [Candidatus Altiarchaeales archaeon]|nr:flavodoxin family protein [Candidatus Altiarchaeales archaeon]
MKVLGIGGSHRRGNTEDLVKKALETCRQNRLETEYISLAGLRIEYCTDCGACRKAFTCSQKDDVMAVLQKMSDADAIIVGSPTYFGCVSGRLKALFDRTLPLRRQGNMLKDKVGAAIAVGGSRNGGQEHVVQQIHAWMLIQEMTVVGDKKTAHFGGIAVGRNPGDALQDIVGVETVVNTALKVVEALEKQRK